VHGALGLPWRGVDPSIRGRHWLLSPDELEALDERGAIVWDEGFPYLQIPGVSFDAEEPAEIEEGREAIQERFRQ
jgi:hypothetical protein